ncbi:hypothetical protein [Nocardia sp. NPDC050717]|uniref:hypothetical protein n=1 Tax=Nocardia sp. NPDC050717 TaxID=3157221 RepID=UPI00340125AF
MGRFVWTLLAGFALGTPAVPIGLTLDLPRPFTLSAVLLGAGCCVAVAVFLMERARLHWQSWRNRRNLVAVQADPWADSGSTNAISAGAAAADSRLSGATGRRAQRIFARFGVAGFGILGPALLGTWGSALLGGALGIPRWRLIRWLMAGIALWSTVLLVVSDAALDVFGIG